MIASEKKKVVFTFRVFDYSFDTLRCSSVRLLTKKKKLIKRTTERGSQRTTHGQQSELGWYIYLLRRQN